MSSSTKLFLNYAGVGKGILRADYMKTYIQSQCQNYAGSGRTVKVRTKTQRIWGTVYEEKK